MTFDKKIFLQQIKDGAFSKNSLSELYRLYKIYNLINIVLEKNGRASVEKLEDAIYTVDNKVLSDKDRIVLELSNLSDQLININDNRLRQDIDLKLNTLNNELDELDLSDKAVLLYFKKNISLLQAKLGMENTFLLAAFESFLELYRNLSIKQLQNKNYKLIRNSKYKYIVEKNESIHLEEKNMR